jgi:hypothetical protein
MSPIVIPISGTLLAPWTYDKSVSWNPKDSLIDTAIGAVAPFEATEMDDDIDVLLSSLFAVVEGATAAAVRCVWRDAHSRTGSRCATE